MMLDLAVFRLVGLGPLVVLLAVGAIAGDCVSSGSAPENKDGCVGASSAMFSELIGLLEAIARAQAD